MSVPDKSIDSRLLSAAKSEFLKKGYKLSSLTDICKEAGVTTGALYKRYAGKEELFSALVSDTVQELTEYVAGIEKTDLTNLTDRELYHSFSMPVENTRKWLRFLYDRRECFTLLIRCASGTRYENFHQDWTEKMNLMDYKYYQEARRRGLVEREITAEELHVLTFSIWALCYEPFLLDFTWEQFERHAQTIHHFINWYDALGFKKPE
ncbi:MAG: TetR/AcrR family transcriptional regulator [Blautia sp.]|nr:TetR/AcrR family transcriptional regulator [Blautia sp.]